MLTTVGAAHIMGASMRKCENLQAAPTLTVNTTYAKNSFTGYYAELLCTLQLM